jgi:cytochrome c oxidase subunit 2
MTLLWILAVVIGVLVLVRLANVAQLASQLANEDDEAEQDRDNKFNSYMLVGFLWVGLGLLVYMIYGYKHFLLPQSASEHGVSLDKLMNVNWVILFTVFFATQILLFTFAFKYRYNKNRRAFYYHDNNKLEAIWTIIPSIVLLALVFTGLKEWNAITDAQNQTDGLKIQIYGKQFDWTARYAGPDNKLGKSSFLKITDLNPLGVDSLDKASADDRLATEMHFPVGTPVDIQINSRDVIHSFFLPHFRVQMNAVPGMNTRFYFKPTITTAKMREITGNPKFDYVLLCNKICGVAHYNMKMKVVVDEPEEFKAWVNSDKTKLVFEKAAPDTSHAAAPPAATTAPVEKEKKVTALK